MHGLTRRQAQVLDLIERAEIPPSRREVGDALGIHSTNGVQDHLDALERKGRLRILRPTRARNLVVAVPLTADERRDLLGEGRQVTAVAVAAHRRLA